MTPTQRVVQAMSLESLREAHERAKRNLFMARATGTTPLFHHRHRLEAIEARLHELEALDHVS